MIYRNARPTPTVRPSGNQQKHARLMQFLRVAVEVDRGGNRPVTRQRETSEIGTPSASAVLANVCRRSWYVV